MLLLSPRAAFFIWPETIAITLKPELSFFMLIDLCVYEIGKKKKKSETVRNLVGFRRSYDATATAKVST